MRLLHLEDSDYDAELVEMLIRREWPDCELKRVVQKEEFQAALEEGGFNLILSDYTLPDFNGLNALEMARRQCPDKPFIFLSGTIGEERAVEAFKLGASDYIIKDRPGRVIPAIRHALADVDARQRGRLNEERVREQAALLDKARDAICVLDLERRVTYWNAGAERLFGWSAAEVLGRDFRPLLFPNDFEPCDVAARKLLFDGAWSGELRPRTKAGASLMVESSWSLVTDAEGRPQNLLLINTDVTARKALEGQLLRAQRMDSIGTLAAGIAHDLNNVLNPILVAAGLLRTTTRGGPPRDLVDTIEAGAQHGAALITQLLAFARGVDGVHVELDPKQLVTGLRQLLQPLLPRNILLAVDCESSLPRVRGDQTQLNQALLNLCLNARDAMPGGGRLEIAAANVVIDEGGARVLFEGKPGPYVRISVTDTGTGIAPEILDRIFDPFFTTKALGMGTGLGLSAVRGIVKGHGGCLQVETTVGRGTTFRLYLPALPELVRNPTTNKVRPFPNGAGEGILLIDDDHGVRNILRLLLEAAGYRVFAVSGGPEALREFNRHREEISLAITDVMMPEMSGPEVIQALRKIDPEMKAIAISGLIEASRGQISHLAGPPVECLAKPVTSKSLFAAIRRVVKKADLASRS